MDFLKKVAGKDKKEEERSEQPSKSQAQGESTGQGQTQTGQTESQEAQGQGAASKPDYVDKAFDQAAKKAGYNIDPNTREKITDAGREAYEKATGKKVPDKVSN